MNKITIIFLSILLGLFLCLNKGASAQLISSDSVLAQNVTQSLILSKTQAFVSHVFVYKTPSIQRIERALRVAQESSIGDADGVLFPKKSDITPQVITNLPSSTVYSNSKPSKISSVDVEEYIMSSRVPSETPKVTVKKDGQIANTKIKEVIKGVVERTDISSLIKAMDAVVKIVDPVKEEIVMSNVKPTLADVIESAFSLENIEGEAAPEESKEDSLALVKEMISKLIIPTETVGEEKSTLIKSSSVSKGGNLERNAKTLGEYFDRIQEPRVLMSTNVVNLTVEKNIKKDSKDVTQHNAKRIHTIEDFFVLNNITQDAVFSKMNYPRSVQAFVAAQQSQETVVTENQITSEEPTQRFVVKFKTDWPHKLDACAHCLLARKDAFQHHLADGSDSIDRINKRVKVLGARTLFMEREGLTTHEALAKWDNKAKKVTRKHAKRAKRALRAKASSRASEKFVNSYVFEVPSGSNIEEICQLYENDEHVEYAHPDRLVRPTLMPNDAFFSAQWAMLNGGADFFGSVGVVDADIDATDAWDLNLGDNIIVAVVDTGIEWSHPDLAANIWANVDETVNGIDSDNNGYIDDVRGWDFTTCTEGNDDGFGDVICVGVKVADNDPLDGQGHGTHVSGTIGAIDNLIGVIGVAPNVELMALKGLPDGDGFGFSSQLAEAIVYATNNGADVINNSWGSNDVADSTMKLVIENAHAAGVVVVFAAGNDDTTVTVGSEADLPETISVGASTNKDVRASFSNYGAGVDVAAPGEYIASTYLLSFGGGYAFLDGTSMASPHVAGIAALMLSYHSALNLTPTQVKEIIKATADDVGIPNLGAGRVNAHKALLLTPLTPTLNAIGNKAIGTLNVLQFNISASDPDGDPLSFTSIVLGGDALATIGATLIDNGDDTATFSWTPTAGQAGLDPSIVFTTADSPTGLIDSETITITITLSDECGNNVLEATENCDDGNNDAGDGCSDTCQIEFCGDSTINNNGTETCDDGNTTAGDGCNATCQEEVCGDGVVNNNGAEFCDDGNIIAGDGCSETCQSEDVCGDGIIGVFEECDDSNIAPGDGCNTTCQIEACGNARIDFGEVCDDGNVAVGDGCNATCQSEVCGDGVVNNNGTEMCDDGNVAVGDGCNATCQTEVCGNGTVDFGEFCDDGNVISLDGCTNICVLEVCGDGIVNNNGTEMCDDGNVAVGDGCSATCQTEVCGNGTVDFGEGCDDGNLVSLDGCTNACVDEFCGDGILNDGGLEICDDGNVVVGDGCNSICQTEVCPNGIVDFGEECDDFNTISGDGCNSVCIDEYCGDGIVNDAGKEFCDDVNLNDIDGCDTFCQEAPFCGDNSCDYVEGENCTNCRLDCGYCRGLRPR
ncbi:MAG: cysteine-rich repeat protein [Candidatus Omnitrophota bacterium]|jgi:cysteine-rich repeat protein